ncbi:protein adenylyltransferase SelO [Pleionea litopenaei]|uniref:Protein nucleotidyltransferase YdiU n=1 Tax=Pleionea litopenaei TaxID=3070815 RepID=A0AA51RRV5_9GAMM|nr:YdiU family protein [Pleionea sp. HL-JVS1]WMS86354.1 YdiU family protein [Pleionea sp. HL-JVS1]
MSKSSNLNHLHQSLDQTFVEQLPGVDNDSHQPKQTPAVCWHHCTPTRVSSPTLIAGFSEVAESLGLKPQWQDDRALVEWLSGNRRLDDSMPYAACYGGHQFGHWAGQLGDGRAITLAEITHERQRFDIQLKGAGPTPYSRRGDGRAVLRSSIREFLCSEAMHHLGIPTTRALSLIRTGDKVVRDMFYDGHPERETGAIVCRVAPSFVRFGNFEILAARQETTLLKQFLDFVIRRDFSFLKEQFPNLDDSIDHAVYAAFFAEVCRRTATMIVHWQRVGFVHGVMNTDNMSILGLTIDYGPYGWLDNYDPAFTPNTTDAENRRYRFSQQPAIARWNLVCLANALAAIIDDHEIFRMGIELYDHNLQKGLYDMQCQKLGLSSATQYQTKHLALIQSLYQRLPELNIDYTLFFRQLMSNHPSSADFLHCFYTPTTESSQALQRWLDDYRECLTEGRLEKRAQVMAQANPQFILRNYLSQIAIDHCESGNYDPLNDLMNALRSPYQTINKFDSFYQKRPEWAENKAGCSMLSCSS